MLKWHENQRRVLRLSLVGESCCVDINNINPDMIQGFVLSGVAGQTLVKLWNYCLVVVIKVTCHEKCSLRVCGLLFAESSIQFLHGNFSSRVLGDVSSCNGRTSELPWQVKQSTPNHDKLQVS